MTFRDCYLRILPNLERLFYPFCAFLLIEYTILFFANNYTASVSSFTGITPEVLLSFYKLQNIFLFALCGGDGPGSYFLPVLVQVIVIIPILYVIGKRNVNLMLIGALATNIAFEIYVIITEMPDSTYRLLSIRYLFAMALGMGLALGMDKRWITVGGLISFIYIFAVNYLKLPPLGQPAWGSQNVFSFIWPLVLVIIALDMLPKIRNILLLQEIGKASYHIFLVQVIYFWSLGRLWSVYATAPFHAKAIIYPSAFFINILTCAILGYIFYLSENTIRQRIKVFIKNHNSNLLKG